MQPYDLIDKKEPSAIKSPAKKSSAKKSKMPRYTDDNGDDVVGFGDNVPAFLK